MHKIGWTVPRLASIGGHFKKLKISTIGGHSKKLKISTFGWGMVGCWGRYFWDLEGG
jgi:hypothetical protein